MGRRDAVVRHCRSRNASSPSGTARRKKISSKKLDKTDSGRPTLPTQPRASTPAEPEQSEKPSSLDLVVDFQVDDWGLILGSLDENAIAAMMGFQDHLRHLWAGLGSNDDELTRPQKGTASS
ncbi:hypothetical protein NCS57_01088200 [Fusarium keratoplasticum]|uniref:Uncharacterized protein n=1 Tax=Fusarium keratoplasticum TaxID=1328300 RepID=A0ACC0QKU6_9HYPO|nr:hypothetical protein NCS57_01088200 [Fusarium keratoplasticum]KAI8657109.1 hypothetical protein NCS57_01088200 [Fusarium keratoplasticum]KAI8658087.1 hypothetical protein NCS55_01083300 [Fusarium keratoplasticum]